VELLEVLKCDVRQRALETLAPGDRVPVGQLARRMGVAQPTVSNHLNILRRMGLVRAYRAGRCIEYQCAPGLVRLEQLNGQLTLTVSRPSGATVTLAATITSNAQTPKAEESANDERRE
jgi:DNA-binding transcriptional ArsR family regulator